MTLQGSAGQHIARALRMRVGDELILFNGEGGEYRAEILALDKKTVTVQTGAHQDVETRSPLSIHLGIAMSRGERMDWVVQKATELGVSSLTPLASERTEVKLKGDRAARKLQHWRQIAISACEQCGRDVLPLIHPIENLSDWVKRNDDACKLVLHHRAISRAELASPTSVALLVGPEGGLSAAEITLAEDAGFESLALGPRVLRTETAPLAALAILQSRWGDMAF